ncbi:MAG: DUF2796 domain-containing protein [Rhodoferax sp.]|nr:DUF2796 domain-containing protein [Rhodoferax sp.]
MKDSLRLWWVATSLTGLAGVAGPAAWAQGHAHVHGQAQLEVVLDGAELQITLSAPLDSLVGFEHAPRTAAQRQTAEAALRSLADPAQLFSLPPAAGCTLQDKSVDAPTLQAAPGAAKSGEHADLDATWRFGCSAPAQLDRVKLSLFERFAPMKRLTVLVAGPAGQGRYPLRRGAAAEVPLKR